MSRVRDQTQNALVTSESPFLMISLVYHTTSQKSNETRITVLLQVCDKQNKPRNLGFCLQQ